MVLCLLEVWKGRLVSTIGERLIVKVIARVLSRIEGHMKIGEGLLPHDV